MENSISTKRDCSIDLLKAFAIISVIIIHTSSSFLAGPPGSFNWISGTFWGSISRSAVPVFFMCSGALMLRPEKELTMKKLWSKSILRLVVAMLVWAFAYKCFNLLTSGGFSASGLWQGLKEVFLFNQEFHFYYLHIILLVYAFLPITRVFVKAANKSQLQYALAIWFVLGILYPTVKDSWPFTLLTGIPAQWLMNMSYAAIGYGLLGYYLKTYPPTKKAPFALAFILGFAITFGGTWFFSMRQGQLYQAFFEGMSLCVFLMAVGAFGLCLTPKLGENGIRFVRYISKASFCIYLVHVLFLNIFSRLFLLLAASGTFSLAAIPCIVSIPLMALLNLLCSLLVYSVLSKIPVVNKWLI